MDIKVNPQFGVFKINSYREHNTNDPLIFAQQVEQVYYTIFLYIR